MTAIAGVKRRPRYRRLSPGKELRLDWRLAIVPGVGPGSYGVPRIIAFRATEAAAARCARALFSTRQERVPLVHAAAFQDLDVLNDVGPVQQQISKSFTRHAQ